MPPDRHQMMHPQAIPSLGIEGSLPLCPSFSSVWATCLDMVYGRCPGSRLTGVHYVVYLHRYLTAYLHRYIWSKRQFSIFMFLYGRNDEVLIPTLAENWWESDPCFFVWSGMKTYPYWASRSISDLSLSTSPWSMLKALIICLPLPPNGTSTNTRGLWSTWNH